MVWAGACASFDDHHCIKSKPLCSNRQTTKAEQATILVIPSQCNQPHQSSNKCNAANSPPFVSTKHCMQVQEDKLSQDKSIADESPSCCKHQALNAGTRGQTQSEQNALQPTPLSCVSTKL